jgi:glycerol uptake facilitator
LAPADLVLVALGFGLALFITVMIVGRASGAHVNPVVTIRLAATGRFPWLDVPYYVGAQVVGAVIGARAIPVVYGRLSATVGHLGAPTLATNTNLLQGCIDEALGAGILMLAIMCTAVDTRSPAGWAALVIGFSLAAVITVIGPATGASIIPARAFGPDVVDVLFGVPVDWGAFLVCYLIGPLLCMLGAAYLNGYLARLPRARQEATGNDLPVIAGDRPDLSS